MEAALSVCSCCCVVPSVSPFMATTVSGAKRGSQTVMFKYKGTKQHIDLCKNHSDATTVPRQMQSLPGQPVPASYLSPHKVPCCNNHLPVPPVFSEASYIASYPQGTAIKEEPSSDTQIKPTTPFLKVQPNFPASFLRVFPALTAGLCKAGAPAVGMVTRAHPAPSLLPLSHYTCLILSWQFFR